MRLIITLCTILFLSAAGWAQQVAIIPKPVSLQQKQGTFTINKNTIIAVKDGEDHKAADFFNDYLQQIYGFKLAVDKSAAKNYIRLTTRQFIKAPDKDGYSLNVTPNNGVSIEGDTHVGTFYGMQTLIQLLPVQVSTSLIIPAVSVTDYPRFDYRGMMLDVGRHFFPVSFVKRYIDFLALHKMNYFHWHLTEDQGWRIEIKKYPKLTEVGGCRNGTIIGHYPGTGNDSIHYCGYYTQDEVREVVKYAADRYITVVPEIEMPGHSSAAIAAYPELSCFPEKSTEIGNTPWAGPREGKQVQQTWGVFQDIYCPSEYTFKFLEDVLDEVIPLFPGKYIHIGGDEAPKTAWKASPMAQQVMKEHNLKDEHELQSYFIQRMEKYINSKGKTIIGWDEILEGGLAPNAIVMSWRGEQGGIDAASQNHNVIMTPNNYVYFDHSQQEKEDSLTIGGYNPLEKVYAYEPVPKELSADKAHYILGAQANLWTEYIPYPTKVEYMIFPRMSALSEVLWTPKDKRNWNDFEKRLLVQFKRYDLWNVHYSRAIFALQYSVTPTADRNGIRISLSSKDKSGKLLYAVTDKHFPKNYTTPVVVKNSEQFIGLHSINGRIIDSLTIKVNYNKATGKKITLATLPDNAYPGEGAFTLVDGIQNDAGIIHAKEFVGYKGNDLSAIIDLGKVQSIDSVVVYALSTGGSTIQPPQSVDVYASADGKNFKLLGNTDNFRRTSRTNGSMVTTFNTTSTRFVKVVVHPLPVIPEGKRNAGEKPFMLVDEIGVY